MIEAVLFDYGGVICDGPFDIFDRYEESRGLPIGFIRELNATNHHENAWARLERSDVSFEEFCELFEKEADRAGQRLDARELFAMFSFSVRPEMVEVVRRCASRYKTGLLTNNFVTGDAGRFSRGEEHASVLELFDVVIESSVARIRKPDPRFYLLACDRLGIEPPQAVFLDDIGTNLKPARELGMTTIKVTSAKQAISDLEQVLGMELTGLTA